ncbi:MAG: pantoate--beta-alanine ligase [Chloroflexi bacterium]|nr:pantoate--beta-alanine ligase [Chloroflexota bacterium]
MRLIETITGMKKARADMQGTVGFVPTMGYLHEGHISLVRRSKAENDHTVTSIFVNPTQFGPREDFARYPRDLPRDMSLLEAAGNDIVFAPAGEDMYPPGYNTWVEVLKLTEPLEGASRPGHFRGVTTVVAKLFNIVQPTRAYFGQKDAQQALTLTKMAVDLNMNLEVITLPTVREPDGLAMSSRNTYLTAEERRTAAVLYRALTLGQKLYADGERDAGVIRQRLTDLIRQEPLAAIEYVSVADAGTLEELDAVSPPAIILLAVKVGRTRLIDNWPLK